MSLYGLIHGAHNSLPYKGVPPAVSDFEHHQSFTRSQNFSLFRKSHIITLRPQKTDLLAGQAIMEFPRATPEENASFLAAWLNGTEDAWRQNYQQAPPSQHYGYHSPPANQYYGYQPHPQYYDYRPRPEYQEYYQASPRSYARRPASQDEDDGPVYPDEVLHHDGTPVDLTPPPPSRHTPSRRQEPASRFDRYADRFMRYATGRHEHGRQRHQSATRSSTLGESTTASRSRRRRRQRVPPRAPSPPIFDRQPYHQDDRYDDRGAQYQDDGTGPWGGFSTAGIHGEVYTRYTDEPNVLYHSSASQRY